MGRFIFAISSALCLSLPTAAQVQVTRTIDGTDNNLTETDWGAADTHLLRLTDVSYTDGLGAMIESPNARAVSNAVGVQTAPTESNALGLSSMFWQWGQFIDHDLDLTGGNAADPHLIEVPAGDGFFTPGSFIPMSRSAVASGTGVTDAREFDNEITHWLDASMVYGSDDARAAELRSFTGGQLQAGTDGYMRRNDNLFENANDTGVFADEDLFLAGDVRSNEQVGLIAMHEVFFRYHNHVAADLAADNPAWNDEELYQTARKIVGAAVQKITYDEWLPSMFGTSAALPTYAGYNDTVNPNISAEFSTAIFRFGHTMLNEDLLRVNADGTTFAGGHLDLFASFFNPDVITEPGSLDAIVRGLVWQEANALDTQVVEDVRSMLFGSPDNGGLDLLSLNIQRGRDHGIGTLNDLRAAFGLDEYSDFSDLTSDAGLAAALASVYSSVDEVDMWIGLMSEDTLDGGMLGETLTVAMLDQFARLRDGDRFFYLNDEELLPYMSLIDDVTLGGVLASVTGVDEFAGDNVFQAVPEPGVFALLGLGGLVLAGRRRTA
ncbi:MAG: peroxidase family protein [Planctomycetota bacterium]